MVRSNETQEEGLLGSKSHSHVVANLLRIEKKVENFQRCVDFVRRPNEQ